MIHVTFLESPAVGRSVRFSANGRVGVSSPIQKCVAGAGGLWIITTQSGNVYSGYYQAASAPTLYAPAKSATNMAASPQQLSHEGLSSATTVCLCILSAIFPFFSLLIAAIMLCSASSDVRLSGKTVMTVTLISIMVMIVLAAVAFMLLVTLGIIASAAGY